MNAPHLEAEVEPAASPEPNEPVAAEEEPPRKPPLLAWWAAIPAALFVAIELVYGWPEAKQAAGGEAVSYFVGRVLGGLLIPLGIAWVVYRFSGRSQKAATLAFTCLIALACVSALTSAGPAAPPGNKLPAPATVPTLADFGDFRFEIAPGWRRIAPDRPQTAALLRLSGLAHNGEGLIKVDVGTPRHDSPREVAQALAGEDGRVLYEPTMLDGVEAVRVQASTAQLPSLRYAVVAFRDGRAYVITAGAKDADISGEFGHVLTTWRWND